MKARHHPRAVATLLSLAPTAPLWAQLQWNVYSTSGALVTANVATGGDATYGGSVTFTVPANTERIFITRSFAPVDLSAASASAKINFTLSVGGGLYPLSGRVIGMGLLNDPGTPGPALDGTGYWTDLHTGNNPPSFELFYRPATVGNFFSI
ncbi:MAG TPA: hypothetical protein VFV96_00175 [Verrucomicrobiae bacterium]|nr:hypothetical protein [Verrucomicrobiae bacterium]